MDYVDLTHAALAALRTTPSSAPTMHDPDEAHTLRGRILGVLIRRSRLSAQLSVEDCATYLRVDAELIEAWELGEAVPSLPQLEGLTSCLRWTAAADDTDSDKVDYSDGAEYALIRQRMISAKLRLARNAQALAVEELSRRSGLGSELIKQYEFGEAMIPIDHLYALAQAVRQDLSYFLHAHGFNRNLSQPRSPGLPDAATDSDLVRFAADDNNKAFIRLAMAFRQIDRVDLHRIAEALYSIINEKRDANGRSPATL